MKATCSSEWGKMRRRILNERENTKNRKNKYPAWDSAHLLRGSLQICVKSLRSPSVVDLCVASSWLISTRALSHLIHKLLHFLIFNRYCTNLKTYHSRKTWLKASLFIYLCISRQIIYLRIWTDHTRITDIQVEDRRRITVFPTFSSCQAIIDHVRMRMLTTYSIKNHELWNQWTR